MPPLLVIPALPQTMAATHELPALPALCELLRLSDSPTTAENWRSGLLTDLGAPPLHVPESVIAAVAAGISAGRSICLATPVHAIAGMHRVHLHTGIVRLREDERVAMQADFAVQFGAELRLHSVGEQWLLEGPFANEADESDPAEWFGAPLERRLARSPEQRRLRRLGAEMEMWLAALPLNAQRQRQGRLAVNLLWVWGGGVARERSAIPALAAVQIFGATDDAWLAGCAALTGKRLAALPGQWLGASRCCLRPPRRRN
jgi:hypothetical protein